MHMWRIFIWPLAVSLFIYIGCNAAFIFVLFNDDAMDIVLSRPFFLLSLIVLPLLFIGVMVGVLFKRAMRYRKRFQERKWVALFSMRLRFV